MRRFRLSQVAVLGLLALFGFGGVCEASAVLHTAGQATLPLAERVPGFEGTGHTSQRLPGVPGMGFPEIDVWADIAQELSFIGWQVLLRRNG